MRRIILAFGILLAGCATKSEQEVFAEALKPFSLPIMNQELRGKQFTWGQGKSPAILVEFYFNGCVYCNQNAKNVAEMATEFRSERIEVLEISVDCEEAEYNAWLKKHPPKGLVLNDCNGSVNDPLGVTGYPTSFIFDCNGNQLLKKVGVWDATDKQKIKEILNKQQFIACE